MVKSVFGIGKKREPTRRDLILPYYNIEKGCRWCGQACRLSWHKTCLKKLDMVRNRDGAVRRAVFKRDKGICAKCGKKSRKWEADHIHPLFRVNRDLPWPVLQLYWLLPNLQTLCSGKLGCHKKKTANEMNWLRGTERYKGKDVVRQQICKRVLKSKGITAKILHQLKDEFGWKVQI